MRRHILFFSFVAIFILIIDAALLARGGREDESFPSKPIRIIVPYARNGGTDVVARALARAAEKYFGQPVQVENIIGGSGAAGMIAGAAAVPDGYTVTMVTRELVSLSVVGVAQIEREDFKLLCLVNLDPAVLAVKQGSRYKTLDSIVQEARINPGKIRFASAAKPHFYILEFERKFGLQFNKIPYNGAAQAIPALLDGFADFTIANPGELKSWMDNGELTAVALMAGGRAAYLPDVPTFSELGYEITSHTWRGLAVPVETPEAVRLELAQKFAMAAADEEYREALARENYNVKYLDEGDFSDFIERDRTVISNIVQGLDYNADLSP